MIKPQKGKSSHVGILTHVCWAVFFKVDLRGLLYFNPHFQCFILDKEGPVPESNF